MSTPNEVLDRFLGVLDPPGEVLRAEEWGSVLGTGLRPDKVPYAEWRDPYVPNEFGVFHYGGTGPYSAAISPVTLEKTIQKVIQWELMHTGPPRNWRGLAYAGAFDEAGNVLLARGFNLYGAHRGDYDGDGISANSEGIPWLWVGGERNHGPSQTALDTWEKLVIAGEAAEGRLYTRLLGHQEIIPGPDTTCPGTRAMAYIGRHRTSDSFRNKWNGTSVPPEPEPDSVWEVFPTFRRFDGWKSNQHLHEHVRDMQALLANRGWRAGSSFDDECAADGLFGNKTEIALKSFQAARGLIADGICGPATWQALHNQ